MLRAVAQTQNFLAMSFTVGAAFSSGSPALSSSMQSLAHGHKERLLTASTLTVTTNPETFGGQPGYSKGSTNEIV
jgi:hypothetical protein